MSEKLLRDESFTGYYDFVDVATLKVETEIHLKAYN